MNILIIGTTDIIGGAAHVSWSIKKSLEENGHNVSMLVAEKISDDPKVKIIPRIKWRKILGFLLGTEDLIKTDWILETDEFKNSDVVHCHNIHGRFFNLKTLQKMSLIKPVIWTLHDEWAITTHCACTMEGNKLQYGLFVCPSIDTPPRLLWDNTKKIAEYKNNIYKKSKLNIVTPSEWLSSKVKRTILSDQKNYLIPNGIDTKIFKKIDRTVARKKLNLPLEKKIILCLADNIKNSPWKGWGYTRKVIEKYKDENNTIFLCVGNETDKESIPDNLLLAGYINSKEKISLYYNAADVLLFTSVAENFPLVILEAMSCGLPIVSFDVGGVKEVVVHKKNGFIANYKILEKLIEGLEWIFSLSDEEINVMSRNSVEKINAEYDINKMIGRYIELYKEIKQK
jgi:glycosyltransferase involved in cell wall biosynthesis